MALTNSRTADKFVVRLPTGMRGRIADEAFANNRSMNSEIIERLEKSLNKSLAANPLSWIPVLNMLVVYDGVIGTIECFHQEDGTVFIKIKSNHSSSDLIPIYKVEPYRV